MTDLERVETIYTMLLSLVVSGHKVHVKAGTYEVDFSFKNKTYSFKTKDVFCNSRYFTCLYDVVKFSMAESLFGREIEISFNDKIFAVIK